MRTVSLKRIPLIRRRALIWRLAGVADVLTVRFRVTDFTQGRVFPAGRLTNAAAEKRFADCPGFARIIAWQRNPRS